MPGLPQRHLLQDLPATISPASHAVEADGWVYLTGVLGRDLDAPETPLPPGIDAQAALAVANLRRILGLIGRKRGDEARLPGGW